MAWHKLSQTDKKKMAKEKEGGKPMAQPLLSLFQNY
jgi:hypothetical protein